MNELVVPPAPHWYKSLAMTCSPDNTLVYTAKNDIVIIKEKTDEKPVQVQIIHAAHSKHVLSVSLNKKWKDPHSYVASLGEDNVIKVWNVDTLEKKTTNKIHSEHKEPLVGAVFAGDDRIVSAASHGLITVWNINTNESKHLNDLFKSKVTLTCLSSCPHAAWLLAFGLSTGCVVVADVRRNGQLLYSLRGHHQSVVALSWCPAPVNVFPRYVNNRVKNKAPDSGSPEAPIDTDNPPEKTVDTDKSPEKTVNTDKTPEKTVDTDKTPKKTVDIDKTPEKTVLKFTKKEKKVNPWVNLKYADDDDVPVGKESPQHAGGGDFLRECADLKNVILGLDDVKKEKKEDELELEIENVAVATGFASGEKIRHPEIVQNRPLPKLFDPSGDFLDDSGFEDKNRALEEKESDEKTDLEKIISKDDEEKEGTGDVSEDKDIGNEKEKLEESLKEQVIEEDPRTEYLLASSAKDRSVYIWRAGTDGRMQTYFTASKKNKKEKNAHTWISLCWVAPDIILTSSPTGEVLAWSLPKPRDSDKLYKIIHCEHTAPIFNIVSPPKYSTAYNWRDNVDNHIWTWGHDGKLVNFDLSLEKIRFCYETVSSVSCIATSSLDPNRVALGSRDGSIRIWDLSLPHTNNLTMQKHLKKITHKVSTIAWHPQKEMVLGFGTEEGRVGFMDLNSKKSSLFPHYFQNQVHKVEWGPIRGSTENLGLYVVAEGKMAIYDMQKPDADPIHLELPEKLYLYKFAWKPDYSLLLLNGKDGSLVVLKTDLVAVTTLYPNDKGVNGIVWHPDSFSNKTEVSPRCNWFAATTTKGVLVFDCASIEENDNFADKIVVTFEGHLRPPLNLAWCPFEGNRIVSTAADGLSHVWDVTTKSAVATYVDFYFSYNVLTWSPVEPDLIIMGDKVLRVWSVSQNSPKLDEEFMATRKRLLTKASKSDTEKVDKNKITVNIPVKTKSNPKNLIVPTFYVSNDENIGAQVEKMRLLLEGGDTLSDSLKIFGTKEEVSCLLDANYAQQNKEGKYKACEMVSLWKGNVGEYIQNAINDNRVTPSIISLAPMVSPKLWQDACLTYAKKLSEESNSDPLETAMYFLVCHKVEDAINSLCLNSMFKEAVALAKHRLPEGSIMVTKVMEQWAQYCQNTGNFENAAYCYISIKDYENAAKVLARRNHKEFLEFAVELAEKAGNKGLSDSIKFKVSETSKIDGNPDQENDESRSEVGVEDVLNLCNSEEKHHDDEEREM